MKRYNVRRFIETAVIWVLGGTILWVAVMLIVTTCVMFFKLH